MIERCTEQTHTLPTTSEHVWQADIHGIPVGGCVRCGLPIAEYNTDMLKVWEKLQPTYFASFKTNT